MRAISFVLALICGWCYIFSQTTETLWLSGHGADDTVQWDFVVSDGMQRGKRSKIEVPSCWEQQGFGEYTYGRWYTKKGERPSTEEGRYSMQFFVPKQWQGKRIDIVFEGVMTDATVRVNGQLAGPMHQGGFTAFSYDVSDKLRYGKKNSLEVTVQKESADPSINAAERKADWWLFGGIYRPVYLTARPLHHIDRATVDVRANGTVNIQLLTQAPRGSKLRASIDSLGEAVMDVTADSCVVTAHFVNPSLWNPEHPNLYDLKLQLIDPDGKVLHEVSRRIGFRTVEFRRGDGFYLNGTKLLVKGVNRHCFYPSTGRTTSYAQDLADVKLIKGMNANAIRSHYPPDSHLLDICDSLGVLYLNELAGWQIAYSTPQGERILREMVVHDAGHPCIFAWSNGNEGGFNLALDSLFGCYDPQQRHVVHAWALYDGVDAHHYPAYQTGVDRLQYGHEVFMPTEFLHAQYDKGGGASLHDFWSNWRESPLFAGGFIWAWVDEGIERTDRGGEIDTDGPNAPDGIVGPHREKEGSWYAIRDVWSPIQIAPVTVNSQWNGRMLLRNDWLYTDLAECSMVCELYNDSILTYSETVSLPHAAPGESVGIHIPAEVGSADILRLVATDGRGDTVNIWSWPTKRAAEYFAERRKGLTGGNLNVEFDDSTGMISRISVNGDEVPFGGGPLPVGFKMRFKHGYYTTDGDDQLYVAKYTGGVDSITWRVTSDGLLGMEAVMFDDKRGHGYEGNFIEEGARAFGLTFSYPEEECTGMKWMGLGPYRVWRNRQQGQVFGIWQKAYNNTVTGEGTLIYPEFKGYHGSIYWAEIESDTAPLTIYSETDGLYLRVFTPQEPEYRRDGKNTMVPFPAGDISFLVDIPPIQSYKPLEQLGPAAQVPTVRINKGDEGVKIKAWLLLVKNEE